MPRLRPARVTVPLLFMAALLTACGGGGGGGDNGGGVTPVVTPALTFNPATVTASVNAGTSQTLNVVATVVRPGDFANAGTVFATLTDTTGVIQPSAQVVRDSDTQYHAVLQTAPALAAGNYKGNFNVKLCRDSGCANQFPGSPMSLPYDITVVAAGSATFSAVSAMPLTASAQLGGAAPASTAVTISAAGLNWTASAGGAAWLKLDTTSGSGNGVLNVSYDTAALAAGQYSATLTISASDTQKATLPVALTVLPSGLVLGSNSVTFNAINGAPIASQIVSLDTDNKLSASWTANSNVGWLKVSPTTGTTPATTVLAVDPTVGKLASGSYTGNVTIAPQGLATRTLPVTLNLTPATLLASINSITLGGVYGRDFSTSQTLNLSLNTGTNSWPWGLQNLPAWATASVASGSVSQALVSTTLAAKPASASVGTTSSLMTPFALVNGDLVSTPVLMTVNKDQHKLLPTETAVAFVFTPDWNPRKTRTITVNDNYGTFAGMTATSDQPWLVVGVNGNQLNLNADQTPLLTDTVSMATITVQSSDPDATAPEPIRVAFWRGAASPAAQTTAPLPYTNVVTDPARPYAYVHNGGAVIDVYNVYTGLKEASMTGFSTRLGDMATSLNGDYLYAVDINNSRITAVDLRTRVISKQLPLAVAGTLSTRLKVVRPNGVEVLLLSDGQAFLTANLAPLPKLPLSTGGTLAASPDSKLVVQQDEGGASNLQHTSVALDYSALGGGTLYSTKVPKASHSSPGTLGQDLVVRDNPSYDGNQDKAKFLLYSASSTPKSCSVMSSEDLGVRRYLSIGDAAPNNIEVGVDGRIFCGGTIKTGGSDIWMYDSTGTTVLQQFKLNPGKQLLPRQMVLSGDGAVLIAITDDGTLTFFGVGP
jgi:hypothetical protein